MKPPDFELQDTADYYTFYVLILALPDEVFWYSDCAFVRDIAENLSAYKGWKNYTEYKEREKIKRRNKSR